jgi:hypothetical protein
VGAIGGNVLMSDQLARSRRRAAAGGPRSNRRWVVLALLVLALSAGLAAAFTYVDRWVPVMIVVSIVWALGLGRYVHKQMANLGSGFSWRSCPTACSKQLMLCRQRRVPPATSRARI